MTIRAVNLITEWNSLWPDYPYNLTLTVVMLITAMTTKITCMIFTELSVTLEVLHQGTTQRTRGMLIQRIGIIIMTKQSYLVHLKMRTLAMVMFCFISGAIGRAARTRLSYHVSWTNKLILLIENCNYHWRGTFKRYLMTNIPSSSWNLKCTNHFDVVIVFLFPCFKKFL